MRTVSLNALRAQSFSFCELEIFPESWTKRHAFTQYADTPRPKSALFFVCTDISVIFSPKSGKTVTAMLGDVVFIPSEAEYSVEVRGGTENRIDTYTLNLRLYEEGEEIRLSENIAVISKGAVRRFEAHIERLTAILHRTAGTYNRLRAGADLYALLDTLTVEEEGEASLYYPIRAGIEALCNEWNENKSVAHYAALCCVSESYFYRCFHAFAEMGPIEYRNTLRLSNAEAMLRNTDMKISEIAETVGFVDAFYFCRTFRKAFGCSPREYRKANK